MGEPVLLLDIILELEQKLAERGQTDNAISQYHYIFRVFSAFSESFRERYFSEKVLEQCLQEHYGITDLTVLSRQQHYKKKVVRAYQMLCDAAQGKPFVDRYLGPKSMLIFEEHNQIVQTFSEYLSEAGRSLKTIDSYSYFVQYTFYPHIHRIFRAIHSFIKTTDARYGRLECPRLICRE